jgi:hypothetical protein
VSKNKQVCYSRVSGDEGLALNVIRGVTANVLV